MEPKGSLPHSQEPATCPYPEPNLGLTSEKYKINKLSRVENEMVLRMRPKSLTDWEKI
jgi:hypothetical protein